MADDPVIDGGDQRQRQRPSGAQGIDERRDPFAVSECPGVNIPHGLVIFGPFGPDDQFNRVP